MPRWLRGCSVGETVLTTERLILRRFRDEDLPHWLKHMNTPEIRAHLGGVRSAEEVAAQIQRAQASWNGATGGYLAVIRRADGEFLGECGCGVLTSEAAPDEIRGELEIGWQLRADRWGHGYATEAARGLLGLVFGRFGRSLIYSQTSEANWRSWRVMERLGMERMAHLDYDDPLYPPEENPTKVYRLTRDEWERRAA